MKSKKRIVLLDDVVANLMICKNSLEEDFEVVTVPSSKKLFQLLAVYNPDLILIDIDIPHEDGFDTIRRIKSQEASAQIPVVFLSTKNDPVNHAEGLRLGAVDFILKPYSPALLVQLINRHLLIKEQESKIILLESQIDEVAAQKRASLFDLQDSLLMLLGNFMKSGSDESHYEINTGYREYLFMMLQEMRRQNIYQSELMRWNDDSLITSAHLYDIGNIGIHNSILQKPGRLTPEEYEVVKGHTLLGVRIIENLGQVASMHSFFDDAKVFAATHHERWDGSGYPLGLKGNEIPLQGRLMAIVDVYNALVSERPYKKALSHRQAVEIIMEGSGTYFDPLLTRAFLSVSEQSKGRG